jgi:hypothetical protein
LLGDTRYGGASRLVREDGTVVSVQRIMLHAHRLGIPWENGIWSSICAVPPDFSDLWTAFGGDAACLQP